MNTVRVNCRASWKLMKLLLVCSECTEAGIFSAKFHLRLSSKSKAATTEKGSGKVWFLRDFECFSKEPGAERKNRCCVVRIKGFGKPPKSFFRTYMNIAGITAWNTLRCYGLKPSIASVAIWHCFAKISCEKEGLSGERLARAWDNPAWKGDACCDTVFRRSLISCAM